MVTLAYVFATSQQRSRTRLLADRRWRPLRRPWRLPEWRSQWITHPGIRLSRGSVSPNETLLAVVCWAISPTSLPRSMNKAFLYVTTWHELRAPWNRSACRKSAGTEDSASLLSPSRCATGTVTRGAQKAPSSRTSVTGSYTFAAATALLLFPPVHDWCQRSDSFCEMVMAT